MKGSQIKKSLLSQGVSVEEMAKRLGFGTAQRLYSALKSDNVKTELLENIAEVLGKPIGWFYGETSSSRQDSPINETSFNNLTEVLLSQQRTIERMQDEIDGLRERMGDGISKKGKTA